MCSGGINFRGGRLARKFKQFSNLTLIALASFQAMSCNKAAGGETGGGAPKAGSAAAPGRAGGRGGPSDRPVPVEIELVKRGSVSRTSVIAGMLEPIRTVGVNAQLSGILLSIKAEEGHRVSQGDVLAEI